VVVIPEAAIRQRFLQCRLNLIRLLPHLTGLHLFDISAAADPQTGQAPTPILLLRRRSGTIVSTGDFPRTPDWAQPILARALKAATGPR
jgi:hypothetical protein